MRRARLVQVACVLLPLVVTQPASAQVHVGVWGGINRARLDIEPVPLAAELDARSGKSLGLAVEIPLSPSVGLSVEPGYVERGTGFRVDTDGALPAAPVRRDVRHSAIEVPVLARLFLARGRVRPYLTAGVSVSALLRSGGGAIGTSYFHPFEYGKWDAALSAGAGATVGKERFRAFVEGRYTWGLVDLAPLRNADPAKSRVVQAVLGVTVGLAGP